MTDEIRPGSIGYRAAQTPDVLACVEGEHSLTWRGLNERANWVAQALHQVGVERGDIVALSMEVRLEWLVMAGALAKLGCSILGVSWGLTDEEACFLLNPAPPQCEYAICRRAPLLHRALREGAKTGRRCPGERELPLDQFLSALSANVAIDHEAQWPMRRRTDNAIGVI
ncbi:AMP-binding protein [Burkholderia sp. BCC0405]|uniref:AMP-binding protein n=1 Tax=Burkholderia sp. BCC0405 TaxID=2676298 RepID=UPI00158EA4F1|nr:AMP-binding protein [Burkholderia sp. BCC0405]